MAEIIITSSILILALILLRRLCWGKISRRLQYGLWLLVVIRLLVPAQFFTSSLSVMQVVNYAGEKVYGHWQSVHTGQQGDAAGEEQLADMLGGEALQDKAATGTEGRNQGGEADGATVDETAGEIRGNSQVGAADLQAEGRQPGSSVETQSGVQSEINRTEGRESLSTGAIESGLGAFKSVLLGIYVVGVLTIAGCLIVCNVRFRRQLAGGRRLIGQEGRLKVYLAEQLESPCLCGILAPAVYMNEAGLVSEERKRHILLHEMTHYRHWDHVWTVVRSLCLVLYWFHPLVWVAAVLSTQDSELACDEGTLIRLGEENRQAYGRTLIEMMTTKTKSGQLLCCATGMINGKKEIKKRITAIAAYKKQVIWTAALVVAFALFLSACTAGTASTTADSQGDISSQGNEETQGGESSQGSEETQGGESSQGSEEVQGGGNSQSGEQGSQVKQEDGSDQPVQDGLVQNADGSFRISEYTIDLTGDKIKDTVVFDVTCLDGTFEEGTTITEELLWEHLWENTVEIRAKVLEGQAGEVQSKDAQETVLWEYSYSIVHAGNGNLAYVKYEKQNCLLQYGNEVYQGRGRFWYRLWKLMPSGSEPVLLKEKEASYPTLEIRQASEDEIAQVLLVEEELDQFFQSSYTKILVNATWRAEECYLYGGEHGLTNGYRRQSGFETFMKEVGGSGLELKIEDYFYPEGVEPITQLPNNPEEAVLGGELLIMEVSSDSSTAGRLDLDGDGAREVLYLEGISNYYGGDGFSKYGDGEVIDDRYRVRVNQVYYESYCDYVDPVLMAYSPDGETILLAIFDHGPSADPRTTFFRYDGEALVPAGEMDNDIREMELVEQGVIKGLSRVWIIQTDWVTAHFIWNGTEMVMREDEEYEFTDYKWIDRPWPVELQKALVVYEERSESSQAATMKPQEVKIMRTDRKEWIYLEAEDGTKGWFRIVEHKIPSLDNADADDVFYGLGHAG